MLVPEGLFFCACENGGNFAHTLVDRLTAFRAPLSGQRICSHHWWWPHRLTSLPRFLCCSTDSADDAAETMLLFSLDVACEEIPGVPEDAPDRCVVRCALCVVCRVSYVSRVSMCSCAKHVMRAMRFGAGGRVVEMNVSATDGLMRG